MRFKEIRITGSSEEIDRRVAEHEARGGKLKKRGLMPKYEGGSYFYTTSHNNNQRKYGGESGIQKEYAVIELPSRGAVV